MKYIKHFEYFNNDDEFDDEVKKEIDKIVDNFDPYVIKYEDNEANKGFSVLVKDKNSDFKSWIDLYITDNGEDIYSEWNQMIYYNNNYDDMVKKGVEENGDVLINTESVSLSKLENDNMIFQENDKYYYYKDYWYIKDGYKESGISLENAKKMKKYNL